MTMTHHLTFGELLGRSRHAAGLTQEALAARAGVSARAISDLERGVKHVPRRDTVRLLVAALSLSPQERALFEVTAQRLRDSDMPPALREAGRATPDEPSLGPQPAALPVVGHLHTRVALARHVQGEGPPLLVLTGEPGIGKTHLLTWAADQAVTQGRRVLRGHGRPQATEMSQEPLLDALRAYIRDRSPVDLRADLRGCAWLVRALPELGDGPIEALPVAAVTPAQERRLVEEAVARFVSNVAGQNGVLLVLDDLHTAGTADLALLGALLSPAPTTRLRVVAAYRDTEVRRGDACDAWLTAVAQAQVATSLSIPPLAPPDAARLLDDLLAGVDTVDPLVRDRVARRADGVPLYLVGWARDLRLEHDAGGVAERVPWAIMQSVRGRIAAVPAIVRTVLEVAAIADEPITSAAILPWVRGTTPAAEALEVATHARLLRAEADGYHVAHEVLRAVIRADLGPARRAALRQRLEGAREEQAEVGADDRAEVATVADGHRSVVEDRRHHLAVLMQHQRASGRDTDADDGGGRPPAGR